MSEEATTRRFRALGHDFSVTTEPALAAYLDEVFAALAADGAPAHRYTLLRGDEDPGRWRLCFDDEQLMTSHSPGFIYSYLCWHVNRIAVEECNDLLLLHASCAADEHGNAVILPAVMESGKTTTVAGLVRSGLRYLTDEATAIDIGTGNLTPYPKPLSVDRGSWEVLADLRPTIDDELDIFLGSQWQVPGDAVGGVADRARPALVVTPGYDASVDGVEIEPLSPGNTLLALGSNAFNLAGFGRDGFASLEQIARECPGYRMRHSDLDAAVAAVRDLLEEATR